MISVMVCGKTAGNMMKDSEGLNRPAGAAIVGTPAQCPSGASANGVRWLVEVDNDNLRGTAGCHRLLRGAAIGQKPHPGFECAVAMLGTTQHLINLRQRVRQRRSTATAQGPNLCAAGGAGPSRSQSQLHSLTTKAQQRHMVASPRSLLDQPGGMPLGQGKSPSLAHRAGRIKHDEVKPRWLDAPLGIAQMSALQHLRPLGQQRRQPGDGATR